MGLAALTSRDRTPGARVFHVAWTAWLDPAERGNRTVWHSLRGSLSGRQMVRFRLTPGEFDDLSDHSRSERN
ncbi:hypothetical protein OPAG_02361 [Rhodococcus opacus PD630]|nr:hypothetical protein OPAG_02361 [Rhodococcus opacus PD630]